jgi:hypothetical protein
LSSRGKGQAAKMPAAAAAAALIHQSKSRRRAACCRRWNGNSCQLPAAVDLGWNRLIRSVAVGRTMRSIVLLAW